MSACKVMMTVFWDAEGTALTDYLERGSTITGAYYADVFGKLRTALKEKRRGKFWCGVLFDQDNAPVHTSSQVLRLLTAIQNARFGLLGHPSYSPKVTPIDFYLFFKLKKVVKESDDEDVICAKNGRLEEQDQQFFYNYKIRALEKRGTKCISVARDYVVK